jgi:hypothetical protein
MLFYNCLTGSLRNDFVLLTSIVDLDSLKMNPDPKSVFCATNIEKIVLLIF